MMDDIENLCFAAMEIAGDEAPYGNEVIDHLAYYSDGSLRPVHDASGLKAYKPPPTNPVELHRRQRAFWQQRLDRVQDEFERLSDGLHNRPTVHPSSLAKLKELQRKVRSVRAKLASVMTASRGYTETDVERARTVWLNLQHAIADEHESRQAFHEALQKGLAEGKLEALKAEYEKDRQYRRQWLDDWNTFQPQEARHVVATEIEDARRRAEEDELRAVEV